MPIPESKSDQSATRRILLASGLGALFGFQDWRLAKYGFAVSIPWYAVAWIFAGHVLLGFSVGATIRLARWWKRGLLVGLAFGLPSALGTHALGLRWAPYGIAVVTGGLVAGFLIALLADALSPRMGAASNPRSPVLDQLSSAGNAQSEKRLTSTIRCRLAEEKACLERLDAEREYRGDSDFGKSNEDRIVWGELLELELQDVDEQVNRICRSAGTGSGHPRAPNDDRAPNC